MRNIKSQSRAFTLVELLVVIGIIAALIGILLPVLSGVASRGRDIQCQSNIRTCVQMMLIYASENKAQLPYGHYFVKSNPVTWDDDGGDGRLVTLWSILSRMSSKQYKGDDVFIGDGQTINPENPAANYAPFIRCPEAMQVLDHICSYAGSFAAFITPYDDYRAGLGSQPLVVNPVKTSRCLPFTAVVWDTAVHPGMNQDIGFVTGGDIDDQKIWHGAAIPQWRYYSAHDPFGVFDTNPVLPGQGNSQPIRLSVGSRSFKNIDPPALGPEGFNSFPYQGNLRFRHGKGTLCNVGYADGHVAQFTGKFNKDGGLATPKGHDALRKYFQVKWPSGTGVFPDPSYPY